MRRRERLPELLAPAGDMQCLYAAVAAGADAVYVGGRAFGARAYAKNFDIDELIHAVEYCHLHGVKLYVTVNTLVYDRELPELSDFVARLWEIGVDAVITADLGVIKEIKRRVPGLLIHASTQMSVHNTNGAEAATQLGCERVVLARELSFENICSVTDKCPIETEIFLHGALCVSHSGQCLMSSLVGGRSGNRGECAQPCRLPYCDKYPLSLSDLSLAKHIDKLISSGVASLKIEGRMKSAEYVYTVTHIYRRLLDEGRCANPDEESRLRQVFSRGNFTDAYFRGKKFESMTGVRSEKDKELTKSVSLTNLFEPTRVAVKAEATMKLGEPSSLTLILGGKRVSVSGAVPTEAINSPLSSEAVKERLSKMGATMLLLDKSDINLTLDEGINLPPSAINALRREAAQAFQNCRRDSETVSAYIPEKNTRGKACLLKTAQFFSAELYRELKEKNPEAVERFDIAFLPLEDFSGDSNGVYIPPVVTDLELPEVSSLLKEAGACGAKYALVSNIGHISLAKESGLIPIGDFRLNVTNSYAREEYEKLGIEICILSPELTLPMARDIGGGEIVYGRIPLMLTERCFIRENFGCERCSCAELTDRTGAKFPILREYGHRNIILNSRPTYMGDRKEELKTAKILHEHFLFTTETAKEAEGVLISYEKGLSLHGEVRRIGKR